MRVLDLFAGLGGWSSAFRDRGHDVVTVDLDPRFDTTLTANVAELRAGDLGTFDVVLASPPCERFSVMQIGRNWTAPPENAPKTPEAAAALELVRATRRLIEELDPAFFVIENPTAKLRRLDALSMLERRTVTYCRYGHATQKSTDLWGGFPPSLELRPRCTGSARNGVKTLGGIDWVLDDRGRPCHVKAERGSRTGIQGSADSAVNALVPHELSFEVCIAAELDLAAGLTWRTAPAGRLFA